MPLDPGACL